MIGCKGIVVVGCRWSSAWTWPSRVWRRWRCSAGATPNRSCRREACRPVSCTSTSSASTPSGRPSPSRPTAVRTCTPTSCTLWARRWPRWPPASPSTIRRASRASASSSVVWSTVITTIPISCRRSPAPTCWPTCSSCWLLLRLCSPVPLLSWWSVSYPMRTFFSISFTNSIFFNRSFQLNTRYLFYLIYQFYLSY